MCISRRQKRGFAAIGALTFEEPSDKVKIKAKKIVFKEIWMETDDFTESISGQAENGINTNIDIDGNKYIFGEWITTVEEP